MSIILLRTVQIIRSHRGKNCKCAAKNEAKVSPESVRWYSASQRESIKSKHLKKGTLIDLNWIFLCKKQEISIHYVTKGQAVSEAIFLGFNSPKK